MIGNLKKKYLVLQMVLSSKVSPNVNTTYTVKISNGLGCEWTLSHTILVNDPSKDIFATADPVMIVPGARLN